jgi:hypothetical protein
MIFAPYIYCIKTYKGELKVFAFFVLKARAKRAFNRAPEVVFSAKLRSLL